MSMTLNQKECKLTIKLSHLMLMKNRSNLFNSISKRHLKIQFLMLKTMKCKPTINTLKSKIIRC